MATCRLAYRHVMRWLLLEAVIISQLCIADRHDQTAQPCNDDQHHGTVQFCVADQHHQTAQRCKFDQNPQTAQCCIADGHHQTVSLSVQASAGRPMPQHLFGIFFEEINHAGAGGLWAELVSNRGFEAGGRHTPSVINPWGMIGDERVISVKTEMSSCFQTNPVALRMDVHCDQTTCPPGGVGVYNPGYWGMNIEEGKTYNVVFYVKSSGPLHALVSLVNAEGTDVLAFNHIKADEEKVRNWTRLQTILTATNSYLKSRLQFTTSEKGTIWLDQVSVMPMDTYMDHGFRKDMMEMLINLKPRFLRFPGGCYVEGDHLRNAFRWKKTVGPWEERPGHFGDVWDYWSDDGLGYLEHLQLAEDLGAEPVWVINIGLGHKDEVDTSLIKPFVQEMLDSVEFARGSPNTTWGSVRAKMGHSEPFGLKYVAFGNENCGFKNYRGNYLKFYDALKQAYPDIKVISNCDATWKTLDHPADLYDYHNYTTAEGMLGNFRLFEKISRTDPNAPKAFVSEYAVTEPKDKVSNGTFEGALAEAAFLLSLEKNSDVVEMVSYAPLFANQNDRRWKPDAIFFNSNQVFGIASYWVQTFFKESSGAVLLDTHLHNFSETDHIYATAISWIDKQKINYITIKVVNFHTESRSLKISLEGVDIKSIRLVRQTVLASDDLLGDNTFDNPTKVVPQSSLIKGDGKDLDELVVQPYSLTAFDLINYAGNKSINIR